MERILVTGSSGFLGQALVPALAEQLNATVIATCRNGERCSRWKDNPLILIEEADLTKAGDWEPLFIKYRPQTVIHLAAVARFIDGENKPVEAFRVNFTGTVRLMELCKKHRTDTFLFTSSDLALNAISNVGITKYLIERLILVNNHPHLRMMGVRIANLLDGNGSVTLIFKKQIEEGKPLTITHPDMSRRFSTREEAVDQLIWLLEHGENRGIYVVNKPPLKIVDLAKKMMKEAGKNTGITFIGAKPGEKLSEPSYETLGIRKTGHPTLARLDESVYRNEDVQRFVNLLKTNESFKKEAFNVLQANGIG